jgi:predicted small lipoprotein YifL
MNKSLTRTMMMAALGMTLAMTLAACGKKEPLKPPPGATYPRHYPPEPKAEPK